MQAGNSNASHYEAVMAELDLAIQALRRGTKHLDARIKPGPDGAERATT
jgi:exonuclease VII small subunit